jgi:HEXXH motif-containing protein
MRTDDSALHGADAALAAMRGRIRQGAGRWVQRSGDDRLLRELCDFRSGFETLRLFELLRRLSSEPCGRELWRAPDVEFLLDSSFPAVLAVASSPWGTAWQAQARRLLDAKETGSTLVAHLRLLPLMSASVAVVSKSSYGPVKVLLPSSSTFPTLGVCLERTQPGEVTLEVSSGELVIRDGRQLLKLTGVLFVEELAAWLDLGDSLLRRIFPWFDSPAPFQSDEWRRRLKASGHCLKNVHPELWLEMAHRPKSVMPGSRGLIQERAQSHSGSHSDAWGAMHLTLTPEPWFSASLAHEHRHDLLNSLRVVEEIVTLEGVSNRSLYSPWRRDRRPAIGLLHGLFAFVSVVQLYLRFLESRHSIPEEVRLLAREDLGFHAINLEIALAELACCDSLTPFGRSLVCALSRESQRLSEAAGRQGAFFDRLAARLADREYQAWRERWNTDARGNVSSVIKRYQ